jgi:hypothetical protein
MCIPKREGATTAHSLVPVSYQKGAADYYWLISGLAHFFLA